MHEFAVWFLQNTAFAGSGRFPNDVPLGWRIAAVADFNRDGQADLLWRSPLTGSNEIWLMNGTTRIARHTITQGSLEYDVTGAADFDGDGFPDLLWRDRIQNDAAVWFMNGTNFSGRVGLFSEKPEFNWDAGATADFNHDGFADILWRDRFNGTNVVWFLRGTDLIASVRIRPEPDVRKRLAGAAHFNFFGNTDLIWRHDDGRNSIWRMSGTDFVESAPLLAVPDNNWQMAGAAGYTNSLQLSAVPEEAFQSLTLIWRHGTLQPQPVERRLLGQANWEQLAASHPGFRLTNALTVGQRYEYRVGGEYLLAGVAAAPIEDRGNVLLVVEATLAEEIESDLALLKSDLVGDGWSVITTNVPRHDDFVWSRNLAAIASIKSFVTNAYFRDPKRTKALFLIGHVPIPYSGFHNPDGKGGRALPADVYYGDVDGIYTDDQVNFPSFLDGLRLARHANFIGDGKFDQSRIPTNALGVAELELAVGRIDFSILPSFGAASEAELTRRYLEKASRYRHEGFNLPNRVMVGTYFPSGPNAEAHVQARRLGSRLFGFFPRFAVEGDPFDPNHAALWGIFGGLGLPFGVTGKDQRFHQSENMTRRSDEPRIAFANVFASFFMDFHYPDNFLRAFLATPTYGLAAMWFKPVDVDPIPLGFEQLGLGETIGSGFVRTLNQSRQTRSANTFIALLGDPTLRLQVLGPPGPISRAAAGFDTIQWSPSREPAAFYLVYRSMRGLDGPWERLTPVPIPDTRFADPAAPFGPKLYQVRTAKTVITGSGSYVNLSQGVFFQLP